MNKLLLAVLLLAVLLLASASASLSAEDPSIAALGTLGTTTLSSKATGVSADGNVVVGETALGSGFRAFRWKQSTGMEELGAFAPTGYSFAEDVSDDGNVVVGGASDSPMANSRAFRWTASGMQNLGTIGGASGGSTAYGVSADGSVVVGESTAPEGNRGFRWTVAGMQSVGTIGTGDACYARAVSADGQTVVGFASLPSDPGGLHAFRWRPAGGLVDLSVAEGFPISAAFGVSPDGETVVGIAAPRPPSEDKFRAARWTASEGMRTFDATEGHVAWDISADGRVAVGQSTVSTAEPVTEALLWIEGEKKTLHSALTEADVDLSQWSDFYACHAVSSNGRVVVGSGHFIADNCTMAFRAVLPDRLPSVGGLVPITVECQGDHNFVTLATTVADGDGPQVTVKWSVDGSLRKTHAVPSGDTASFLFDYSDGEHDVQVEVSDALSSVTAGTTVTVSDTTKPVVVVAPNVTLSVNEGKLFATRNRLKAPNVTDLCDEAPSVTNNARARLPLGRNLVRWTAIDADGNAASANQRVKVVNAAPKANAGRDIRKTTSGDIVRATLDGTKSSDRDGHRLTFAWTAPGIPLVNGTRAKATGTFPIGTTIVKLKVTDPTGARSIDTVRVIVRRTASAAERADAYAAHAYSDARTAVASWPSESAASGYQAAELAYVAGTYAAAAADPLSQTELRQAQASFALSAGDGFLRSYLDGGSDESLSAAARSYSAAEMGLQALEE